MLRFQPFNCANNNYRGSGGEEQPVQATECRREVTSDAPNCAKTPVRNIQRDSSDQEPIPVVSSDEVATGDAEDCDDRSAGRNGYECRHNGEYHANEFDDFIYTHDESPLLVFIVVVQAAYFLFLQHRLPRWRTV